MKSAKKLMILIPASGQLTTDTQFQNTSIMYMYSGTITISFVCLQNTGCSTKQEKVGGSK